MGQGSKCQGAAPEVNRSPGGGREQRLWNEATCAGRLQAFPQHQHSTNVERG